MVDIKYYDTVLSLAEGETVLEGLLRNEIAIANGCRAGACQACLMQARAGDLPRGSQAGLKNTLQARGFFLSCQCKPTGPLEICLADEVSAKVPSAVLSKERVSDNVLRVRLQKSLEFRAGQYLNIWHGDALKPLIRSYSIASVPTLEDFIELHIKIISDGRFSRWAADAMEPGTQLTIQGALGNCFYAATDPHKLLLLAGIGTGLAPLYGIVRDALSQGHEGKISLVLGARTADGFYLRDELAELQRAYPQLTVAFVCQSASQYPGDISNQDIYQYIKQQHANTKGVGVYLCGAESFVRKLKKQIFLSGAAMNDIYADAFLPCS